jgi:TRAP-type C4-dicarboxylate transport system permease small subunit
VEVLDLANAFRPSWSRPRMIVRLLVDGFALALAGILLSAGPWVQVTSTRIPAASAAAIEWWMNLSWLVSLLVAALIYAARVVQHARRVAGREPIRNWALKLVTGD